MLIKTKNGVFKCDNVKIDNKMMKAIKSFNGEKAVLKTKNGDFKLVRVNNAAKIDKEGAFYQVRDELEEVAEGFKSDDELRSIFREAEDSVKEMKKNGSFKNESRKTLDVFRKRLKDSLDREDKKWQQAVLSRGEKIVEENAKDFSDIAYEEDLKEANRKKKDIEEKEAKIRKNFENDIEYLKKEKGRVNSLFDEAEKNRENNRKMLKQYLLTEVKKNIVNNPMNKNYEKEQIQRLEKIFK